MKQLFPKNEIKSRLQPAKAVIATDAEITVKVLNTVMKPQSNNLKKKKVEILSRVRKQQRRGSYTV